jgi:exodeoxyribonuclease VII large subunit
MQRCARQKHRDCSVSALHLRQRLARVKPSIIARQLRQTTAEISRRLRDALQQRLKSERAEIKALRMRLQLLSPENVLGRGYSITTDVATGKILRNAAETKPRQKIHTRLKTGTIKSVVES